MSARTRIEIEVPTHAGAAQRHDYWDWSAQMTAIPGVSSTGMSAGFGSGDYITLKGTAAGLRRALAKLADDGEITLPHLTQAYAEVANSSGTELMQATVEHKLAAVIEICGDVTDEDLLLYMYELSDKDDDELAPHITAQDISTPGQFFRTGQDTDPHLRVITLTIITSTSARPGGEDDWTLSVVADRLLSRPIAGGEITDATVYLVDDLHADARDGVELAGRAYAAAGAA